MLWYDQVAGAQISFTYPSLSISTSSSPSIHTSILFIDRLMNS